MRTAAALIVLSHAAATLATTQSPAVDAADVAPADAPIDAPAEADHAPEEAVSTASPSAAVTSPPTSYSPTSVQNTSAPTSMSTSTTDPAGVFSQIESILNVPIVFTFNGVQVRVTMTTASYVEAAGGVVYTTTLAETLTNAQVTDVAENGFVNKLSIALAGQAGIVPASRIPYATMAFTGAQGHRSRALSTGLTFSVCNAVQNGVCVTYSPTSSPTVVSSPTKNDDGFPVWGIALCVVLPVLAVAAGVVVFFACKNSAQDGGHPAEEVSPQSDKPNDNEPAAEPELRDSQV